jgi:hypothetical protein
LDGSSKAFKEGAAQVKAFCVMPWCKTTILFRRIGAKCRLHLQSQYILIFFPPVHFTTNLKKKSVTLLVSQRVNPKDRTQLKSHAV